MSLALERSDFVNLRAKRERSAGLDLSLTSSIKLDTILKIDKITILLALTNQSSSWGRSRTHRARRELLQQVLLP